MVKIETDLERDVSRLTLGCSFYTEMMIARIESVYAKGVDKVYKAGASRVLEFGVRIVSMRLYMLIDVELNNAEEGAIHEEGDRAVQPSDGGVK